MLSKSLCIGIDVGGSETELRARIPSEDEDFQLYGPGANPKRIGTQEAAAVLADLVRQALDQRPESTLRSVCVGVAGANAESVQQELKAHLRRTLGQQEASRFHFMHDAYIALEAAYGSESGVAVIAGTGSFVFARMTDGSVAHVGGWGYLIGDEGSGYALGCAALQAISHDLDGGPSTQLRALLADRHDLHTRESILDRFYHVEQPIQNLATLVLEAAEAGDAVAVRILNEQTFMLARQVDWLARRASEPSTDAPLTPRIALFGGLTSEEAYVEALRAALEVYLPSWSVQPSPAPPVAGALQFAMRTADAETH